MEMGLTGQRGIPVRGLDGRRSVCYTDPTNEGRIQMETTASWEIMDNGVVLIALTNALGVRELWFTREEANRLAQDIIADRLK